MTFSEWFMRVDPNVDCSLHDMVWEGDYAKARDIVKLVEEAFEAGYNACLDDLINGSNHSEWIEVHKETLEELKK